MSLAQALNAKPVDQDFVLGMSKVVAEKIRTVANPDLLILFGSAVNGRFKEGSDLDFLIVFNDLDSMKLGRKKIRALGKLHSDTPVDLVFVSKKLFDEKKDIGGICFIAHHDGIHL